jgi:hypothetical protein
LLRARQAQVYGPGINPFSPNIFIHSSAPIVREGRRCSQISLTRILTSQIDPNYFRRKSHTVPGGRFNYNTIFPIRRMESIKLGKVRVGRAARC